MAPEQASSSNTDQRSDLFSVGIILWESLTGRRLFKGDSNAATLNKLLYDTIVKPSEVWPELAQFDDVVMRALNRDPDARFQDADEFSEALDKAAGRGGVAKTREVAELVRALDAEKLQNERRRLRDAIEMLGRSQIAESTVPMPREGTGSSSQTYDRDGGESAVHGSAADVLSDGTPVFVRIASESAALRWLVMVLAAVVFLYAGFLVWQLLRTPGGSPPGGVNRAAETAVQAEKGAEPLHPPPGVRADTGAGTQGQR
jgi:hypothetical protein